MSSNHGICWQSTMLRKTFDTRILEVHLSKSTSNQHPITTKFKITTWLKKRTTRSCFQSTFHNYKFLQYQAYKELQLHHVSTQTECHLDPIEVEHNQNQEDEFIHKSRTMPVTQKQNRKKIKIGVFSLQQKTWVEHLNLHMPTLRPNPDYLG